MYDADGDRLIEDQQPGRSWTRCATTFLTATVGPTTTFQQRRDYGRSLPHLRRAATNLSATSACQGYELTRSLDFNDPDSYAAGAVNPEWDGGDGWDAHGRQQSTG